VRFLARPQTGKGNRLALVLNRPPPTVVAFDFVVGGEEDAIQPVDLGAGGVGESVGRGNAAELHAIARASKQAVVRDGADGSSRGDAKKLSLAFPFVQGLAEHFAYPRVGLPKHHAKLAGRVPTLGDFVAGNRGGQGGRPGRGGQLLGGHIFSHTFVTAGAGGL
jgi:hypothetical protein